MSRLDLKKYVFYGLLCYTFIFFALVTIGMDISSGIELDTSEWLPMAIYFIFFAIGYYFYRKIVDPFISLIVEAFAFAAMLGFGALFASISFLLPWLVSILFFEKVSKIESLSKASLLVIKLHVGYYVFSAFLGYFASSPNLSLVFVVGGILSGITMIVIDFFADFLLKLTRRKDYDNLKEIYLFKITKAPLLWPWALIFARLMMMRDFILALLMMIPMAIVYLYVYEQRRLKLTVEKALDSITFMVGLRDSYTYQHSKNVEEYSRLVSLAMGLSEKEADEISKVAVLHDIGKVGIADHVLLKSGSLERHEWKEMKRHPVLGANLINLVGILNIDVDGVRYHHEKWDGTGYPEGLKGEAIPLCARIISICDAWNAMRTERPYRKALPYNEALKRIREGSGQQFDPQIVREAIKIFQREEPIKKTVGKGGG